MWFEISKACCGLTSSFTQAATEVQTAIGAVLAYLSENLGDVDATRVAELSSLIGDGAGG